MDQNESTNQDEYSDREEYMDQDEYTDQDEHMYQNKYMGQNELSPPASLPSRGSEIEPEFRVCPRCDATFRTMVKLEEHQAEQKHFMCNYCGKRFEAYSYLYDHRIRNHHEYQDLVCPGCNVSFDRVANFWIHIDKNTCPGIPLVWVLKNREKNLNFEKGLRELSSGMDRLFARTPNNPPKAGEGWGLESPPANLDDFPICTTPNVYRSRYRLDDFPRRDLDLIAEYDAIRLLNTDDDDPSGWKACVRAYEEEEAAKSAPAPPVILPDDASALQPYVKASPEEKQVTTEYHAVAPPASYYPTSGVPSGSKQKNMPKTSGKPVKAPAKVLERDDELKRSKWMHDPDHPDWDARLFYKKENKIYICPHAGCFKSFYTVARLTKHLRSSDHMGGNLRCVACAATFPSVKCILSHMEGSIRCGARQHEELGRAVGVLTGGLISTDGHKTLDNGDVKFVVDLKAYQAIMRDNGVSSGYNDSVPDAFINED